MVVNLSYSFIPLQKLSQKGVDRSVENPQKCAEPYTVPIARRGRTNLLRASKRHLFHKDMIGQKSFYVRGRKCWQSAEKGSLY